MKPSEICKEQVATAVELLRALAHPARLLILSCLFERERAVGEIERELGLKQPGLSQQLAELRDAGLVATRRESKSVFYRIADNRVILIVDALCRALTRDEAQPSTATAAADFPGDTAETAASASAGGIAKFARGG